MICLHSLAPEHVLKVTFGCAVAHPVELHVAEAEVSMGAANEPHVLNVRARPSSYVRVGRHSTHRLQTPVGHTHFEKVSPEVRVEQPVDDGGSGTQS